RRWRAWNLGSFLLRPRNSSPHYPLSIRPSTSHRRSQPYPAAPAQHWHETVERWAQTLPAMSQARPQTVALRSVWRASPPSDPRTTAVATTPPEMRRIAAKALRFLAATSPLPPTTCLLSLL